MFCKYSECLDSFVLQIAGAILDSLVWALSKTPGFVVKQIYEFNCWSLCTRVSAGINLLIWADRLLSMDVNFLIATHCQMLIALDANEFLAAKKDVWSLSKVVRTPGSEYKHDTDQSQWNPRVLFSSTQIAFATFLKLSNLTLTETDKCLYWWYYIKRPWS